MFGYDGYLSIIKFIKIMWFKKKNIRKFIYKIYGLIKKINGIGIFKFLIFLIYIL